MIILASGSPQRKAILKKLDIKYRAIAADIDEHHSGHVRPHAIVKSIALRKAKAIAEHHPNDCIIGCDTIVILSNGEISVKPKDRDDAKKTIKLYQNSHCDVYSGLAVITSKKTMLGYEKTRLNFSNFTNAQIEEYLDSGEWKNRSGSMTIEGKGGGWVKKVDGCYWNVVGLPIDLLKKFLIHSSKFSKK
ncbi:septum formation protein Maf [Patescibacteria group bacterium]|nr:septum formation protein Maf [Patescibacteria group bacterium]